MASIAKEPTVALLACALNLKEAAHLTEVEHPDLVVIAADQADSSNVLDYLKRLNELQIKYLVLVDDRDPIKKRINLRHTISFAVLRQSAGLGCYIAQTFGLCPSGLSPGTATSVAKPKSDATSKRQKGLIVIGASTGGIEALLCVLSDFPKNCPPTLIVQHINGDFLPGFAQRLDRHCEAKVQLAEHSKQIEAGHVYLAPGNSSHLTITPNGTRCRLTAGDPISGHRPSIDALFRSAATHGQNVVGALLTGMGRDGAEGLAAIRSAGGWTICQDQATCTVYGMPRAAVEIGAAAEQLPIEKIGPAILRASKKKTGHIRHATN